MAKRYYNICNNKNFSKGRSSLLLSATILYTICRLNKFPIFLMDFADLTKINMYKIGLSYIKLVKLLNIQIEIMDPALILQSLLSKF